MEGPQAVREALAAGALVELFTTDPALPLAAQAGGQGVPVTVVTAAVLAALGETTTPQGLLGVAGLPAAGAGALPGSPRLVAVLDAVNDPGNAGTVLRTADAAGADAVVLTEGSTDPYGGKCVRASAGSLWHVPVVTGVPVLDAVALLRGRGLRCSRPAARARTTCSTSRRRASCGSRPPGSSAPRRTGCRRGCSPPRTAGAGPDPRRGRVAQPRGGGRGVPVRVGARRAGAPRVVGCPDLRAAGRPATVEGWVLDKTAYDELPDGVLVADGGGAVVSVNPAAQRLLGLTADAAVGRDYRAVLPLSTTRAATGGRAPTRTAGCAAAPDSPSGTCCCRAAAACSSPPRTSAATADTSSASSSRCATTAPASAPTAAGPTW